jgi:hypothetical protein
MKGKKPYNIRNVEAHINNLSNNSIENTLPLTTPPLQSTNFLLNKKMIFQHNAQNNIIYPGNSTQSEYINAKYGVSRYASNLVSGKMFKKI